jgi:hypothetical protein
MNSIPAEQTKQADRLRYAIKMHARRAKNEKIQKERRSGNKKKTCPTNGGGEHKEADVCCGRRTLEMV